VPHLGIDEESFLKRHQYVRVVVDLDAPRIWHGADERKATSLTGDFTDLTDAQPTPRSSSTSFMCSNTSVRPSMMCANRSIGR
jgi:hypothetical protein